MPSLAFLLKEVKPRKQSTGLRSPAIRKQHKELRYAHAGLIPRMMYRFHISGLRRPLWFPIHIDHLNDEKSRTAVNKDRRVPEFMFMTDKSTAMGVGFLKTTIPGRIKNCKSACCCIHTT